MVVAPVMAAIYVPGALVVILLNIDQVLPTFGIIFREAFNPTAVSTRRVARNRAVGHRHFVINFNAAAVSTRRVARNDGVG